MLHECDSDNDGPKIKQHCRRHISIVPDVEYAGEELLVGGDELAAVEDELLLQHGVEDAEGADLGVDGLVQHRRRLRLVEHDLGHNSVEPRHQSNIH